MGEIYHGTTKQGLSVIKPFKRFTPGGPDLADHIPPRIYATYNPAYAVAHSFPWSSEDGVGIILENDMVTMIVPKDKQQILEQSVCVYTLPDDGFTYTEEEEMGLTYHSIKDVMPTYCKCFDSVTVALQHFGGRIQVTKT